MAFSQFRPVRHNGLKTAGCTVEELKVAMGPPHGL